MKLSWMWIGMLLLVACSGVPSEEDLAPHEQALNAATPAFQIQGWASSSYVVGGGLETVTVMVH